MAVSLDFNFVLLCLGITAVWANIRNNLINDSIPYKILKLSGEQNKEPYRFTDILLSSILVFLGGREGGGIGRLEGNLPFKNMAGWAYIRKGFCVSGKKMTHKAVS